MNESLAITTTVTILLALAGYLITYTNNLRLSQRSERLARVNKQLGELYGPLLATCSATTSAWRKFREKYRPGQGFFDDPPTDEELKAWRLWMSTVFMPNNLRMYELVVSKADLLMELEIPECLLKLCAHVSAYQAIMEKWKSNDFTEHKSLINFPSELLEYCTESFRMLKSEQARLIGKSAK